MAVLLRLFDSSVTAFLVSEARREARDGDELSALSAAAITALSSALPVIFRPLVLSSEKATSPLSAPPALVTASRMALARSCWVFSRVWRQTMVLNVQMVAVSLGVVVSGAVPEVRPEVVLSVPEVALPVPLVVPPVDVLPLALSVASVSLVLPAAAAALARRLSEYASKALLRLKLLFEVIMRCPLATEGRGCDEDMLPCDGVWRSPESTGVCRLEARRAGPGAGSARCRQCHKGPPSSGSFRRSHSEAMVRASSAVNSPR